MERAVAAAREGDETAIRAVYRHLNPLLIRYLRHHLRRDAEDVASEVWVNLAQLLASFEGGLVELKALMFTIARRRLIDHQRRVGRMPATTSLDDLTHPTTYPSDDTALANLGAQDAVDWIVGNLPPNQAEVVILRVLGDLDVQSVATIVGKSVGSVRVLQHRALRRLQQEIDRRSVTTSLA